MSILSLSLLANNLARVFAATVKPSPKTAVRFADIRAV